MQIGYWFTRKKKKKEMMNELMSLHGMIDTMQMYAHKQSARQVQVYGTILSLEF